MGNRRTNEDDHVSLEGQIERAFRSNQAEETQHSSCHARFTLQVSGPLALSRECRCRVGFALGLPANICEGCLQMPAVANGCPTASGVREVPPFTRGPPMPVTQWCCQKHTDFNSIIMVMPWCSNVTQILSHLLEVRKFINTNPFGHEQVASRPLQRGCATPGRRTKVGPRCGVRWPGRSRAAWLGGSVCKTPT